MRAGVAQRRAIVQNSQGNPMKYFIKHSEWQWLIEQDAETKKYLLSYKKPTDWTPCNSYDTPEQAANAVSTGTTGLAGWDGLKQSGAFPAFAAWLIDPSDGILAKIISIAKPI
jgi:hypothetical protein